MKKEKKETIKLKRELSAVSAELVSVRSVENLKAKTTSDIEKKLKKQKSKKKKSMTKHGK